MLRQIFFKIYSRTGNLLFTVLASSYFFITYIILKRNNLAYIIFKRNNLPCIIFERSNFLFFFICLFPVNIYLFRVMTETQEKDAKSVQNLQESHQNDFINYENICTTINIIRTFFQGFYCWLWRNKYFLGCIFLFFWFISFTFFWFLYSLPETYLSLFYTVSIVIFEHVFAGNLPFTISSRIPSVKGNIQLRKKSCVSFLLSKIP